MTVTFINHCSLIQFFGCKRPTFFSTLVIGIVPGVISSWQNVILISIDVCTSSVSFKFEFFHFSNHAIIADIFLCRIHIAIKHFSIYRTFYLVGVIFQSCSFSPCISVSFIDVIHILVNLTYANFAIKFSMAPCCSIFFYVCSSTPSLRNTLVPVFIRALANSILSQGCTSAKPQRAVICLTGSPDFILIDIAVGLHHVAEFCIAVFSRFPLVRILLDIRSQAPQVILANEIVRINFSNRICNHCHTTAKFRLNIARHSPCCFVEHIDAIRHIAFLYCAIGRFFPTERILLVGGRISPVSIITDIPDIIQALANSILPQD